MRALIADDSVLVREGIARHARARRASKWSPRPATTTTCCARRAATGPTSPSSTSACRPTTPTRASAPRARSAPELPGTGVLVLSQHLEAAYALELLRRRLGRARLPAQGPRHGGRRSSWTPSAASPTAARRWTRRSSQELLGRRREDDPLEQLTPREREVLSLMAEGLTNAGIAARLVVTEKAVERHVTAIFSKLLLDATSADHRRVLAVLKFLERDSTPGRACPRPAGLSTLQRPVEHREPVGQAAQPGAAVQRRAPAARRRRPRPTARRRRARR